MSELIRKVLNLPEAASTFAPGLDTFHFVIICVTMLGALGVTALTIGFVIRHHEYGGSRGKTPRGIPRRLEYTIIGALLAMFVSFWVIGFRQYVAMATPPSDTFDVYVIGKQWMWAFAYAEGGVSNHDLYVPVGRPVRLLITSRDVIHSFFVPAMRVKQDAVPGRTTIAWFEVTRAGEYEILCAEFCGLSHSRMRGTVVALPPEEYDAYQRAQWDVSDEVAAQAPLGSERRDALEAAPQSLVAMGRRVAAERGCLRCHTLDGTPHLGPSWAGLYEASVQLADGRRVVADAPYLTRAMMDPTAEVHAGFAPIMPSYQGLLDAAEVAAVLELIRSLQDRAAPDEPAVPLPVHSEQLPQLPVRGGANLPARPASTGVQD